MSIAFSEFLYLATRYVMGSMQPASETRVARLNMLVKQFGSIAELNTAIGWARTDPKLAQIRKGHARSQTGKAYKMGESMAAEIENALKLPRGWMDTPPTYAELHNLREDEHDPRMMAHKIMDGLSDDKIELALRLLTAFAQPDGHPKAPNG